jgi:hypothetical protein
MNFRPAMVALLMPLVLAACGGSSHSSTSSASTAAQSTPSSSSSSSTASTQSPASSSTSLTTSTTRPPEVPRSREGHRNRSPHPVAPASGVRIPASFTIQHGGALTPTVISVPKGVTIELQVKDLDSHGHSIRVDVPAAPTVGVSPGASASAAVTGLANGSHRVLEDGHPAATILVGTQGGP